MKREGKRLKTHKAPRGIYKKGAKGWPVPGIQAPYEEPKNPELVIETNVVPIEKSVKLIKRLIAKV